MVSPFRFSKTSKSPHAVHVSTCSAVFTSDNTDTYSVQWSPHISVTQVVLHYLQMEAKIIMSRLLNSFTIRLPSDYVLKVVQRSTIKPADNVPCSLELMHVDLE